MSPKRKRLSAFHVKRHKQLDPVKKQKDKDCPARRLQLKLPPRPLQCVKSIHNIDEDNVMQKPIMWPTWMKKEDHRNRAAMQLLIDKLD